MNLELQLECELQLARRARVRRWESRGENVRETCRNREASSWKRRQSDDGGPISGHRAGLTEIRVIEEIKHIRAELEVDSLGDFGVLDQGKIYVRESWSINCVAAEIPEATNCR